MSSENNNKGRMRWGSRDAPDKIRFPDNPPIFESRDAPTKTRSRPSNGSQSDGSNTEQSQ